MPHKDGTLKGYERDWVARDWLKLCISMPFDWTSLDIYLKNSNLTVRDGELAVMDTTKPVMFPRR